MLSNKSDNTTSKIRIRWLGGILPTISIYILSFIVHTISLSPSPLYAAECQLCNSKILELNKEKNAEVRNQEYLKKNQNYVSTYSKSNPSGVLKAKSNIFLIILKLETVKNNMEALNMELTKKGCSTCPRN